MVKMIYSRNFSYPLIALVELRFTPPQFTPKQISLNTPTSIRLNSPQVKFQVSNLFVHYVIGYIKSSLLKWNSEVYQFSLG